MRYVLKLPEPTTPILAKGTMVHEALEKVFDHPKKDRTLPLLENLLREAWSNAKAKSPDYGHLFEDVKEEREWGLSALSLLGNYVKIEDPARLESEPVQRETWVRGELPVDPEKPDAGTFLVRGIVDRIDLVRQDGEDGEDGDSVVRCITDYKSGKAPFLKYNEETNTRIFNEKFWQLKVYAVLLRAMGEKAERGRRGEQTVSDFEGSTVASVVPGLPLRRLKLMFMTSETGEAEILEYDLGATAKERSKELDGVAEELRDVWVQVRELVARNDPKAWGHCKRGFCNCKKAREVFVEGSLAGQ